MGDRSGRYFDWTAFLRCPHCGSDRVGLDHYDDGTLLRCRDCGAEGWAGGVTDVE